MPPNFNFHVMAASLFKAGTDTMGSDKLGHNQAIISILCIGRNKERLDGNTNAMQIYIMCPLIGTRFTSTNSSMHDHNEQ